MRHAAPEGHGAAPPLPKPLSSLSSAARAPAARAAACCTLEPAKRTAEHRHPPTSPAAAPPLRASLPSAPHPAPSSLGIPPHPRALPGPSPSCPSFSPSSLPSFRSIRSIFPIFPFFPILAMRRSFAQRFIHRLLTPDEPPPAAWRAAPLPKPGSLSLPPADCWRSPEEVEAYALACIAALELEGWSFAWDRAVRRLGCCRTPEKRVSLSRYFVAHYLERDVELIRRTLLHELAHALCWERVRRRGHGPAWRACCAALGIPGERATVRCESFARAPEPPALCPLSGRQRRSAALLPPPPGAPHPRLPENLLHPRAARGDDGAPPPRRASPRRPAAPGPRARALRRV